MELYDLNINPDGSFNLQYYPYARITQRTVNSVAKWYNENGLLFDKVRSDGDVITVLNARFAN